MTTLCIIRHGETDWNLSGKFQGREDIELNETGRQQAQGCINFLKQEQWDRIISSPLKRAKETAQIMQSTLTLPEVEVFQDLIEMDFGSAAGLLPEERVSLFPDGVIHDQESREQVIHRVLAELDLIHKTYPNQRIILVTHGMVISVLMSHLSEGKLGTDYRELKNTCINYLSKTEAGWQIDLYNHSVLK